MVLFKTPFTNLEKYNIQVSPTKSGDLVQEFVLFA